MTSKGRFGRLEPDRIRVMLDRLPELGGRAPDLAVAAALLLERALVEDSEVFGPDRLWVMDR